MEIEDAVKIERQQQPDDAGVAQDAQFVISILNGEQHAAVDERRRFRREPFIAPAELEVLGDARPPRARIFTRDANRWGVGFVSQQVLPIGRDATLRIWAPPREVRGRGFGESAGKPAGEAAGEMLMVRCCVLRCREVLPGWFEGAALFYTEEPRLESRGKE